MNQTTDKPDAPKKRATWVALLPLAIFVALAGVFAVQLLSGRDSSTIPSALIGREAPQTALPPVEGLMRDGVQLPGVKSADFKTGANGKLTLVNVWASWCAPCRVEHPVLMGLAETDAVKQGKVALVGMNYKDEAENARRFLGALGNPFSAVGVDRAGRGAIEWGVYGVPETFVIGPDGRILEKHVGPLDLMAASKLLQRALKAR